MQTRNAFAEDSREISGSRNSSILTGSAAVEADQRTTTVNICTTRNMHANARVQRANDDAAKCALYPYRSRCNEMLGITATAF